MNTAVPVMEGRALRRFYPVGGGLLGGRRGLVRAVDGISFALHAGRTLAVVGESGSGKSTLARMAALMEPPDAGELQMSGQPAAVADAAARRKLRLRVQMVFQNPYGSLNPRKTVGSILMEPLVINGRLGRAEREQAARDMMQRVGLRQDQFTRYPHMFSGGQRQRIAIARALMLNPPIVVADEPVSALDVSIQAQIQNLLKELQQRRHLTYIFISHDLAVVKYMADTIGVMYLGKLVEVGPARDIYERAAHPYTRALIDTIPEPDPHLARATRGQHIRGELPSAMQPPSGCRFRTRCPFVQEICAVEEPPLRPFGPRHLAACHFPLQTPTGDAPSDAEATLAG